MPTPIIFLLVFVFSAVISTLMFWVSDGEFVTDLFSASETWSDKSAILGVLFGIPASLAIAYVAIVLAQRSHELAEGQSKLSEEQLRLAKEQSKLAEEQSNLAEENAFFEKKARCLDAIEGVNSFMLDAMASLRKAFLHCERAAKEFNEHFAAINDPSHKHHEAAYSAFRSNIESFSFSMSDYFQAMHALSKNRILYEAFQQSYAEMLNPEASTSSVIYPTTLIVEESANSGKGVHEWLHDNYFYADISNLLFSLESDLSALDTDSAISVLSSIQAASKRMEADLSQTKEENESTGRLAAARRLDDSDKNPIYSDVWVITPTRLALIFASLFCGSAGVGNDIILRRAIKTAAIFADLLRATPKSSHLRDELLRFFDDESLQRGEASRIAAFIKDTTETIKLDNALATKIHDGFKHFHEIVVDVDSEIIPMDDWLGIWRRAGSFSEWKFPD